MVKLGLLRMVSISYKHAEEILKHIEEIAEKDGDAPVAISVFNAFGQQIAFLAMDGTLPISTDCIATNKAHSALAFKKDTNKWVDERGKPRPAHFNLNTTDPHFTTFPGGVVIKIGEDVLGSIGVSGRHGSQKDNPELKTLQDHELAVAGRVYITKKIKLMAESRID